MPVFIVFAEHGPESCPAGDSEMGKMPLSHLDNANVRSDGHRRGNSWHCLRSHRGERPVLAGSVARPRITSLFGIGRREF